MGVSEKVCPHCTKIVKAAASGCRYCGYNLEQGQWSDLDVGQSKPDDAKKRSLGKGCIIAIGAIVFLGLISAMIGGNENNHASDGEGIEVSKTSVLRVSARTLAGAYETNEVAAQENYGGQPLAVTGRVVGISPDFMENSVVQIRGSIRSSQSGRGSRGTNILRCYRKKILSPWYVERFQR